MLKDAEPGDGRSFGAPTRGNADAVVDSPW